MAVKKVLVCPKCGSRDIDWHKTGRGEFKECRGCGHVKYFIEEEVDEAGEDLWP